MTQQHASLSRIALSVALATSLTAAPLATAAAEDETTTASTTEANAVSEEEKATDEEATVVIDAKAWTPTRRAMPKSSMRPRRPSWSDPLR